MSEPSTGNTGGNTDASTDGNGGGSAGAKLVGGVGDPPASAAASPSGPQAGRQTGVGPVVDLEPIHLGLDEDGQRVTVTLAYRNLLVGGEPGAGKSVAVERHRARRARGRCRLVLIDGKLVELGLWAPVADVFVGPDLAHAIDVLGELQAEMDAGYRAPARRGPPQDRPPRLPGRAALIMVCVVDEMAYFSATVGDKKTQEEFTGLLRDLVARGRAAGVIVVAATQRPTADIIPTSLRDLFGYRWRSAAPPTPAPTSSSARLGQRATPPRTSRRGQRGRLAARRRRHPPPVQGRLPHRPAHRRRHRPRPPQGRRPGMTSGDPYSASAAHPTPVLTGPAVLAVDPDGDCLDPGRIPCPARTARLPPHVPGGRRLPALYQCPACQHGIGSPPTSTGSA